MNAVIKLSSMGDIIHSLVVLPFLQEKIDFIVDDTFKEILEENPYINKIIPVKLRAAKKEKILFFKEFIHFKEMYYDKIYDIQGLFKSALFAKLATENLIGYKNPREKIAALFYNRKIQSKKFYAIERYLELFEIENEEFLKNHPNLLFFNDKKFEILSNSKKNIIFIIGGSWKCKKLPLNKWIELANSLKNENVIIPYANGNEKKEALKIQQNTKNVQIINLNLNDLKALISKADLLIGNDTGPSFIAWANNINNIILYGCTFNNKILENSFSKSIEVQKEIKKGLMVMDKIEVKNILKKIDEF